MTANSSPPLLPYSGLFSTLAPLLRAHSERSSSLLSFPPPTSCLGRPRGPHLQGAFPLVTSWRARQWHFLLYTPWPTSGSPPSQSRGLCLRDAAPCAGLPHSRPRTRRGEPPRADDPRPHFPQPPWVPGTPLPPPAQPPPTPRNSFCPSRCPRNSPSPTYPASPGSPPDPTRELRPQPREPPAPLGYRELFLAAPRSPSDSGAPPSLPRGSGKPGPENSFPLRREHFSPLSAAWKLCHPSESPLPWEPPRPTSGPGSLRLVTFPSPQLARPGKPLPPPTRSSPRPGSSRWPRPGPWMGPPVVGPSCRALPTEGCRIGGWRPSEPLHVPVPPPGA